MAARCVSVPDSARLGLCSATPSSTSTASSNAANDSAQPAIAARPRPYLVQGRITLISSETVQVSNTKSISAQEKH